MSEAAVIELKPGDIIKRSSPDGERSAVFVAQTQHPIWPHLRLVIWYLDDGTWSFDALDIWQRVGEVEPSDFVSRTVQLKRALLDQGARRYERDQRRSRS